MAGTERRTGVIDFRTWVPDRGFRVPAVVEFCGWHRGCPNPPVAEMDRHSYFSGRTRRLGRRWIGFCEEHLAPYHRLVEGVVEAAVAPGSPAANRGYTPSDESR